MDDNNGRIYSAHVSNIEFESVQLADQSHPFDAPNDVTVNFGPLWVSGDGHDLAANLEQAASAIRYALRRSAMEQHPSFDGFTPQECEGSDMPAAGAPIPPGAGYVPPAIEAAVDWLELAGDLDFDVRSSSMMRQRDVQADELGEPWDLISDPDEAA